MSHSEAPATRFALTLASLSVVVALLFAVVGAVLVQPVGGAAAAERRSSTTPLRVGTFNVHTVRSFGSHADDRPWKHRRRAVISAILRHRLDVVGIQEASQNPGYRGLLVDGANQYLDIRNGLNKAGGHYALTNVQPGSSRTTRILFDRRKLSKVRAGSYRFPSQSGGANDTRYLVWAVFRHRGSGKRFFFGNTHLANGSTDLQRAQWQQLIDRTRSLASGLPVVVVGDFQRSKTREPAATMMRSMAKAGFADALGQRPLTPVLGRPRARRVQNAWINSVNHYSRNVASFSNENRRDTAGNSADWIFAANRWGVHSYEVVVRRKGLRVVGTIPSDHNLVRATLLMR
jgi:hypothetical protein